MRKTLLLSASALIACSIGNPAKSNGTGVYMGFSGAMSQGNNKVQAKNHDESFLQKGRAGIKGFHGGTHLGFQKEFKNKMVCGLEAGYHLGYANASKTTTVDDDKHKISLKRKRGFNVSTKIGYELNSWTPYLRAGYDSSQFTAKTQIANNSRSSKSHRLNGLMLGFGLETQISKILIGVEWVHTLYRAQKFNKQEHINCLNDKHGAKIGDFKIRLSYKV